jgi:hypothetical protein
MKLNELDDGWGHKDLSGGRERRRAGRKTKSEGILGEYLNIHQVKFV